MRAGLLAANEGRLPDAERLFRAVLAGDPGSASGHSNLGNVLLQAGRPAAALAEFDAAVALAPGAAVPLLNRSLALEQLAVEARGAGQEAEANRALDAALADATAACAADPTEPAAFFDAGGILQRLGQTGDALAAFRRAADLAPGLPGYRLRVGTLQFEVGDDTGAGVTVRGVTRRAPQYGEAHAVAAALAYAAGDVPAAETALDAALRSDGA